MVFVYCPIRWRTTSKSITAAAAAFSDSICPIRGIASCSSQASSLLRDARILGAHHQGLAEIGIVQFAALLGRGDDLKPFGLLLDRIADRPHAADRERPGRRIALGIHGGRILQRRHQTVPRCRRPSGRWRRNCGRRSPRQRSPPAASRPRAPVPGRPARHIRWRTLRHDPLVGHRA